MQSAKLFSITGLCLIILMLAGCGGMQEVYVEKLLESGTEYAAQLKRDNSDVFSSVTIRRDGENPGVVLEHVLKAGAESAIPGDIKAETLKHLRAGDQWEGFSTVLGGGVYMKVVYKKSDGSIAGEATINKDDL